MRISPEIIAESEIQKDNLWRILLPRYQDIGRIEVSIEDSMFQETEQNLTGPVHNLHQFFHAVLILIQRHAAGTIFHAQCQIAALPIRV